MCAGVLPLVTRAMRFVPKPNVAHCNSPSHSSPTKEVFSALSSQATPSKCPLTRASVGPAPAMMARYLVFTPFQI